MRNKNLILMGGGSPENLQPGLSFLLERAQTGRIIFLPQAAPENLFAEYLQFAWECLKPLGLSKDRLSLSTDLSEKNIAGVWIGGGNTFDLLQALRNTVLGTRLLELIDSGIWVAGNSAGAIIFGKDIRYAHDPNNIGMSDFTGFNLIGEHAVWCHYDPQPHDQEIATFHQIHPTLHPIPILALPNSCTATVQDNQLRVQGPDSLYLFSKSKPKQSLPENSSYAL